VGHLINYNVWEIAFTELEKHTITPGVTTIDGLNLRKMLLMEPLALQLESS
jgi:hypothetical protein